LIRRRMRRHVGTDKDTLAAGNQNAVKRTLCGDGVGIDSQLSAGIDRESVNPQQGVNDGCTMVVDQYSVESLDDATAFSNHCAADITTTKSYTVQVRSSRFRLQSLSSRSSPPDNVEETSYATLLRRDACETFGSRSFSFDAATRGHAADSALYQLTARPSASARCSAPIRCCAPKLAVSTRTWIDVTARQ